MGASKMRLSTYLIVLFFVNSHGSRISFKAYPSELKANITAAASMRCELLDTDSRRTVTNTSQDILHVTSILITDNEGQAFAHASAFDPPSALTDVNNLDVKGDVTGISSSGYLELSWKVPALMSVGQYSCEVTTIDSQRHTTVFRTSLELTRVPPSLHDLVVMLQTQQQTIQNNDARVQQLIQDNVAELSSLKSENVAQAEMIKNQNLRIDSLTDSLNNKSMEIDSLKKENRNMTDRLNNQSLDISQIKSCVRPIIGFTAAMSGDGDLPHLSGNVPVVYDKVLTDTSSSYNNNTGVFVCPVSGLYHFTVNCVVYNKHHAVLQLWVNSSALTSTAAWDNEGNYDSCSASATVAIHKGDEVRVHTGGYNADMYQDSNIPQSNVFSGHLVASDDCRL